MALKCFVEARTGLYSTLLEEIDVCVCQAGKTYTWLLGGEISRSLPLSATGLTTIAFVTDIGFQFELF